ncbi:MAG: hypothetical protein AB2826_19660 [Candidatus Thiodiazotropha sp.]
MTGRGKQASRMSYAGRDPALSRGTPDGLRDTRPVHTPFDHARCPYISRQLKDQSKSEAQRRDESGRGSLMVKLHRPFPELRPKYEEGPVRSAFNQAWFREQRAAQLKSFKAQRQVVQQRNRRSAPTRER